MTQLAARTAISDTYPNPSNAVARAGFGVLWDVVNENTQAAELTLASAATTNIGGQLSTKLQITGTTTITSLGTTYRGPIFIRFAAGLVLTHNATTLVLPGGGNISTSAGDTCTFIPKATSGTSDGWVCVSYPPAWYPTIPVLRSYLAGLTLSTAGSSTTMTIAAGVATDSTNAVPIVLPAAISKTTASWAVGTAAGGLDTGSIAPNTWYHFYVIRRPDTGVVDGLSSLSATAPTLPTNYTQFRWIGAGRTNGSSQWTKFTQNGGDFTWDVAPFDVDVTTPGTSAVLRTLTVPSGVVVEAIGVISLAPAGATAVHLISDTAITDSAPGTNAAHTVSALASGLSSAGFRCRTNTSGQIRSRNSTANADVVRIFTLGWRDTQGRNA